MLYARSHRLRLTHAFKPISFFAEQNAGQPERDAATPLMMHSWARYVPKNKLYLDDSSRQPLGHQDGLWVLMRLSTELGVWEKVCCSEARGLSTFSMCGSRAGIMALPRVGVH